MNNVKKRGVAYIRESTEEQDKGFSPENQTRTIQEYATRNNIELIGTYKDLLSGTNASKRQDFQRMVADAKEHKFDIVLVFHTSRFARNVQEARKYKDLLRNKLGVNVVSVTQPFGDWDNPSAFLNEGVNELFDEYASKQISFWVRSSLNEKRRQGKQLGNPPFGYCKKKLGYDKERGKYIYSQKWLVESKEAKLVKEIFKLYATGTYSYADIAVWLNKKGVKTKYKNVFTYTSIKGILNNKVYLGHVYSKRNNIDAKGGIHPHIISNPLFDKVQETIAERRNTEGRPLAQYRFYLLQGLVYCYHCFKHIKGKENDDNARLLPRMYCQTFKWKDREYLAYACKFRRENKSCCQKRVACSVIDKQVIKYMGGFQVPEEIKNATLEKLQNLFEQREELSPNEEMLKKLNAKRKKVNFVFENTNQYTEEEYLSKLKKIDKEINEYGGSKISTIPYNAKKAYMKKTKEFLENFNLLWKKMGEEEQRAWIQMTIKRVWVKDEKVVAIEPREDFKGLFTSHRKVLSQAPVATHILL